jgi:hypothetical protein
LATDQPEKRPVTTAFSSISRFLGRQRIGRFAGAMTLSVTALAYKSDTIVTVNRLNAARPVATQPGLATA